MNINVDCKCAALCSQESESHLRLVTADEPGNGLACACTVRPSQGSVPCIDPQLADFGFADVGDVGGGGGAQASPVQSSPVQSSPVQSSSNLNTSSTFRLDEYQDATNKWPGETPREWGRTITMDMDMDVQQRKDGIFATLGF